MNDLELCKKFAELEGVELVESFGKIHDASKVGKYGSEYNPIIDRALIAGAIFDYKVSIKHYKEFNCAIYGKDSIDIDCCIIEVKDTLITIFDVDMGELPKKIIECILKSEGLSCAAAKQ